MKQGLRRIAYTARAGLFTVVIHTFLIVALLAGLWWPFSENKIERGSVKPIQAQAISNEEIEQQVEKQKKKLEEKKKAEQALQELKKKQEEEKKKLEELAAQRKKEERELEKKRLEEEKKKLAEKKKKEEEEKQRLEEEKKRKEEEEKQRLEEEERKKEEAEKKKKEEEDRKRKEAEKRKKEAEAKAKREKELQDQLEKERIELEAANALTALVDRIATAVENNWRRPLNSTEGLKALIRVKVGRNGEVLSANVVKSSGDRFFDQSAEVAVKKASPLPFPADSKYYEFINEFNLLFNPDDY